jgi:hypothetical protein
MNRKYLKKGTPVTVTSSVYPGQEFKNTFIAANQTVV